MIERLYEINRVLTVVHTLSNTRPTTAVPIDSVVRLCRDTVVRGRLPDHEQTIQFAATTGLLAITENEVELLSDGIDFLSLNPENYIELTEAQLKVLARKQYFDGVFASQCRRLLKTFSWSEESQCLVWSELDDAALDGSPWLVDHLCQLRVLIRTPAGYETVRDATQAVLNFIEEPKGLTEDRLRQILLEKEAVGDIGEERAMIFERNRLMAMDRVVDAHCVRRISRVRVNAGYDIESFNGNATSGVFDRFIEVKAARGRDLRFFWTENEMKVAESLRDRYWIYFLGGIDPASRTSTVQPLLFQNPLQSIMQNVELSKTSQGILVQGKIRGVRA